MRGPTTWLLAAALTALACDSSRQSGPGASASATPIAGAECQACGMVVREQPSPRGQVVHRDGKRVHLCSVGELLLYLREPSPHGAPSAVFVEALDPEADPHAGSTAERPWIRAESGFYVVGVPRKGIMGSPVLAYDEQSAAERAAARHGGRTVRWTELSTTSGRP